MLYRLSHFSHPLGHSTTLHNDQSINDFDFAPEDRQKLKTQSWSRVVRVGPQPNRAQPSSRSHKKGNATMLLRTIGRQQVHRQVYSIFLSAKDTSSDVRLSVTDH